MIRETNISDGKGEAITKKRNGSKLFAGVALVLLFSADGSVEATAQTAPEENTDDTAVVTATKRAASIQDVPMSVTAFSGELLEGIGANNAEALMHHWHHAVEQ
jgi:iron complex outermembrane receptor protein